jgi:hypothetical protein
LIAVVPFAGWIEYLALWDQPDIPHKLPPLTYFLGALPIFIAIGTFGIFLATAKLKRSARFEICVIYPIFAIPILLFVGLAPTIADINPPIHGAAGQQKTGSEKHVNAQPIRLSVTAFRQDILA